MKWIKKLIVLAAILCSTYFMGKAISLISIVPVKASGNVTEYGFVSESNSDLPYTTSVKGTSNGVSFALKLKASEDGIYTVSIKTHDYTSIASAGDYSPITDGKIKVTVKNGVGISNLITINTKIVDGIVKIEDESSYFFVTMTQINDMYVNKELKCYRAYKYDLEYTKLNDYNQYILKNYEDKKSTTIIGGDKIIVKPSEPFYKTIALNSIHYGNNASVDMGLSEYFVSVEGKISGSYWANYDWYNDFVNIYLKSTKYVVRDGYYPCSSLFSWEQVILSESESEKGFYKDWNWTTEYSNSSYYGITKDNVKYFIEGKNTYYDVGSNSAFLCFDNPGKNTGDLEIKDFYAKSFIADTTAPKILGSYVLDDMSNLSKDDKLKIAVRFSEPVQYIGNVPYLYAKTDSLYNSTLNFEYKAGMGTDTLVFEFVNDDGLVYNFSKIKEVSVLADHIRDFSYSKYTGLYNYVNNEDLTIKCDYDVKMDTRTPSIEIANYDKLKNIISKTKDITILANNISEEGLSIKYKFIPTTLYDDNFDFDRDLIEQRNVNSYTFTEGDKNGDYYLYIRATSYYGKVIDNKDTLTSLVLKFDSTPPRVEELNVLAYTDNDGVTHYDKEQVKVKILDEPYGTTDVEALISKIKVVYSPYPIGLSEQLREIIVFDENSIVQRTKYEDNVYSFILDGVNDFGLKPDSYLDLYVGIVATDKAGNEIDIFSGQFQSRFVRFDLRSRLDGEFDINGKFVDDLIYSYDKTINLYETNASLSFTISQNEVINESTKFNYVLNKFNISSSGKTEVICLSELDDTEAKEYFEYSFDSSNNTYNITLKQSGYYEVTYNIDKSKYSETFKIYISDYKNSGSEVTGNFNNFENIINKAYSTADNILYYADSTSVKTVKYNNSTKPQMFSSLELLKEYIKISEYQDLYAIVLTDEIAQALNSGISTTHRKAQGENTIPKKNQIWIRYKKASWSFSTSYTEWVYYYYGNFTGGDLSINVNNLSVNLKSSINAVVEKIASKSKTEYLVTDEYLLNGVPYLDKEQIHPKEEQINQTILNIPLENAIFSGDDAIYNSYYEIDGTKYYIASNDKLKFNPYTRIFYVMLDSDNHYTEIASSDEGKLLREILETGRYAIVELDDKGYSRKFVYITKEAPGLVISYVAKNDEVVDRSISKGSDGQIFNAKQMQIKELLYDIDDYAYVAIYNYNNLAQYSVYYKADLADKMVELTSGKYLIEVGDRFGNNYQFTIQLNNEAIDFNVQIYDNEYIKVLTSLTLEDVYSFDVYLNGDKIDVSFAQEMYFKDSGLYRFYLEDIYGNVYEKEYELKHITPVINWHYELNNDFININELESGVVIKKVSDNFYKITTNGRLQFSFASNSNYSYKFQSPTNYNETDFYGTKRITLNEATSFKVRVYYTDYPSCYVEYGVVYDNTPPIIQAFVDSYNYIYDDRDILEKPGASFDNIKDVGFEQGESSNFFISSGDEIYSNKIHLSFQDEVGISYVKIMCDSKIIYEANDNIATFELSKYGFYEIICKDLLGNSSSFSFTNTEPKYFTYYLDGTQQSIDFNPLEVFENDIRLYGCDNIIYKFSDINELALLVDGKYYLYTIEDSVISERFIDNGLLSSRTILDGKNTSSSEYQGLFEYNNLIAQIAYEDGYFKIKVTITDFEVHDVAARILSDNSHIPFYSHIELYAKKSEIIFNGPNTPLKINDYIGYSNDIFSLNVSDKNIINIAYAYNQSQTFEKYTDLALNDLGKFGQNDGYYSFIVTNKYNNKTEYLIIISRSFLVSIDTGFNDGYTINYQMDYKTEYYSDNNIIIKVYDLDALCFIKLNNEEYKFDKNIYSQYYEIILDSAGTYDIEVSDSSGNVKSCRATIQNEEFKVSTDILVGLNSKALRKDELYTNQKVSINPDLITTYGIYLISCEFDGNTTILYDNMSMNPVLNGSLSDIVGAQGSGLYKLMFRNIYGKVSEFDVKYRNTSTLNISRMTLSDVKYQDYTFINNAIYSNSRIKIESYATRYIFKVNDKNCDCPYEFRFPSNTISGSYEYQIYYLDEYGFEYTLNIYLIRQDIEYEISKEPKLVDSMMVLNTDFYLDFSENYSASYILDEKTYEYKPKTYLKRDGSYIFIIVDLAGNKITINLKKDSIVDFMVKDVGNDRILVSGDVTNNQVMLLPKNGDDIKIDYAYLNGILIENPSQSFTDNGKWEIIVSDAIGNRDYFSFYLFTHAISSFVYKSPYNYKITEITYKDVSGNKISFMDNVLQKDYCSEVDLKLTGTYNIVMKSISDGNSSSFEIVINNTVPNVSLVGVENGGSTNQNVTLTGYKEGDTILIYKDNTLIQTIKVSSNDMKSPVINDMGDYRIEVVNVEGNKTILEFRRSYTANTASSIFIVVVLGGIAVVLFIGLFSRKREKIE